MHRVFRLEITVIRNDYVIRNDCDMIRNDYVIRNDDVIRNDYDVIRNDYDNKKTLPHYNSRITCRITSTEIIMQFCQIAYQSICHGDHAI